MVKMERKGSSRAIKMMGVVGKEPEGERYSAIHCFLKR